MDNETETFEKNEMTASKSNLHCVNNAPVITECIEDKYNKLRGFVVKLKKKISDLNEQVQTLELEKKRITTEKEELQQKVIQISDNAKKLQIIQLEYDKLQDEVEQNKLENKKLLKNIETLVKDNTSLKEVLFQEKENLVLSNTKLQQFIKDKKRLEQTCKESAEEIKKLKNELKAEFVIREQKDKECEDMKAKLDLEIIAYQEVKNQLDIMKQERKNSSVLSLEVQNYEKSIEEMKSKLAEEISRKQLLEKTIDEHLDTIIVLNKQISELRDSCLIKTNQIISLEEKYQAAKADLSEAKYEISITKKKTEELEEGIKEEKMEKAVISKKFDVIINEKDNTIKDIKLQKESYEIQIKNMSAEISRLNELLAENRQEMENLQKQFTNYKLRAQSVLRTQQSSRSTGNSGKSIIEIEEELEQTQLQNIMVREKCDNYRQKAESLTNELTEVKNERDEAIENRKQLNHKILNLKQDIVLLIEQNKVQDMKIQHLEMKYQKEMENIENQYKIQIEELKAHHREELLSLKVESKEPSSNMPEKKAEEATEVSNESSNLLRTLMPLIEREECEGSENVDCGMQARISEERNHRHSLMPLDELLNSSDDCSNCDTRPLSRKISRHELEACELRIKHLTALLADAERDIAKLTQLNELLKEDIRRQQRSVEREEHANNFEYLKNVVLKFITLKNGDERNRLVPVLTTILKLSPEEVQKLNAVSGVVGKSWIPGIPILDWHNN